VQFLGEQDGTPERLLKSRLIELFMHYSGIQRAYLAQVSAEDHFGVALCVRNISSPDRNLAREIGAVFAEIFGAHEYLDILFLSDAQETSLVSVCSPFFWAPSIAYEASFPVGTTVRIAERPVLEHFLQTWKFHNPLKPEQLASAGQIKKVDKVAFYQGGDPLYVLEGTPGVWHKQCLTSL